MLPVVFLSVRVLCEPAPAVSHESKNTIIVMADTTLDSMIFPGFSTALVSQLEYDLASSEWTVLLDRRSISKLRPADSGASVLMIKAVPMQSGPSIYALIEPFPSWKASLPDTQYQPLVNFVYSGADTAAAALLVAKKIVENLRGRYACRLLITSAPPQAAVRSATGMIGTCPVQWDVAFGIIDIEARKPGYLAKTVRLNLSDSRKADTAVIVLTKRRLYHSPAFYPAITLGLVSAVLYGCEYYYYQKYRRLDGNDLANNPGVFGKTFDIARNCEYGGDISLGLASALFCVTFLW
jgi:hypothetical protein